MLFRGAKLALIKNGVMDSDLTRIARTPHDAATVFSQGVVDDRPLHGDISDPADNIQSPVISPTSRDVIQHYILYLGTGTIDGERIVFARIIG